jgi:hypothetical protein
MPRRNGNFAAAGTSWLDSTNGLGEERVTERTRAQIGHQSSPGRGRSTILDAATEKVYYAADGCECISWLLVITDGDKSVAVETTIG